MKERYLDLMEAVLDAYTPEHIRAYTESVASDGIKEHGFPRLTANLGVLIAHGRKTELQDDFLRMMELCCREIPTARSRNGDNVGNEFSVKEIIFCLLEIEQAGIFAKSLTDGWRRELAKIDPYAVYSVIAEDPPKPINNWAAFGAASEQVRQYAGIGADLHFIENQIASQLFCFDENGMYRDPNEPMVYDLVTRLQLAIALWCGYDGADKDILEEQFMKSADLTLLMQSVTAEIPYGGRSNQFLHNETFYAALCEFYAVLLQKHGDTVRAGQFKRAARLATESICPWLQETQIRHIKNLYPIDSGFGCESYAYFDKYMVTTGSWLYMAYLFADDSIEEMPCPSGNGRYICETSPHFHKVFLKYADYFVEVDTNADTQYDASGIGRIQKRGAPSALCLSVPFTDTPHYRTDIVNPSGYSICGGVCSENGAIYGFSPSVSYRLTDRIVTEDYVRIAFACEENGIAFTQTVTVSDAGVEITVCGTGRMAVYFPLFAFDGERHTDIFSAGSDVWVTYRGYRCRYTTDGDIKLQETVYENRNGRYRAAAIYGETQVTLYVSIEAE